MRGSSDSGRGPFTVPRITGVQRNVHHPLYLPPANTYDTTLPEPCFIPPLLSEQVRAVAARLFQGLLLAPFDDFPVVPAKESLRNSPSAVVRRAGVMGEIQQRADLLARCAIRRVPGLARIGL